MGAIREIVFSTGEVNPAVFTAGAPSPRAMASVIKFRKTAQHVI
jgi:hypothetical protein